MFSTVDAPPLRSLQIQLLSELDPVVVTSPESLQKLALRVTNFPTAPALRDLAGALARVDYSSPYPIPGVAAGDSLRTFGVVVRVWKMSFDATDASIGMVAIAADTVDYLDGARWIYSEVPVN